MINEKNLWPSILYLGDKKIKININQDNIQRFIKNVNLNKIKLNYHSFDQISRLKDEILTSFDQ